MAKAKRTSTKVENESKRDRFTRLASKRTQQVIQKLVVLSKCSNRASYEYTPADLKKMGDAIVSAYNACMSRFSAKEKSETETFTF